MIVLTDRLGKGLMVGALSDISAESVAEWFVRNYLPHHFLPSAIVSDRGTQFTSAFWKRVCDQLHIVRRLSTAFSPETDGATERANEVVETVLRELVNWAQDDWVAQLPIVVSAIMSRTASSTKMSPFFLGHGWEQTLFDLSDDLHPPSSDHASPVQKADALVRRLRDARDFAQAAIASAQDNQARNANRYRDQAQSYDVGDKVWLNLEHIRTNRPSKKLDQRYAKYTVTEVLGSHNYRLDTPPGIHNVFHTRRLRPVSNDPLPGQVSYDTHLPGIVVEDEESPEYEVESILDEKRARGRGTRKQYLVKWKGYARPTWEPESFVRDLQALDVWEARTAHASSTVGTIRKEEEKTIDSLSANHPPSTLLRCDHVRA